MVKDVHRERRRPWAEYCGQAHVETLAGLLEDRGIGAVTRGDGGPGRSPCRP